MNRSSSSSSSSSKAGRKWSLAPTPADPQIRRRKKQNPRSPLKDLNGIASCSSSNASSISIDAPRGCLRFLLSNSSSSRTPLHRTKVLSKTPKSAPTVRPSKPSRSKPPKDNPSKTMSQKLHKSKKIPPCLYQWQSGKKAILKAKSSPVLSKPASGSEVLKQQQQQQWLVDDDEAGGDTECLKTGKDENLTPVSKLICGSGLDCTFDKVIEENSNTTITTTPPVEASVSPEIQWGPSVLSTTPACYGAGHVVSGVTDNRKCRPRGILAVGETDLGLGRGSKAFDAFGNGNENAVGVINSSRVSIVPLPIEASMHWLVSPCDEEDEDPKQLFDNGSHRFQRLVGSTTPLSPSSPSSGHGFSSNVCNSIDNTTSTTTTASRRRRTNSLISPCRLPEVQGFLRPPSDHIVDCPLESSPHATPSCRADVSQEEKKYRYNLAVENSPFSMDSLGSGNVIQTPQSDSSSDRHVGLGWLNAVDQQKCQFESELDALADVLQTTNFSPKSQRSMWDPTGSSFQFDSPTTPSNSMDFTQLQRTWDYHASWISDSTLENVSQSQMRISWREGLVSRIFEMDEFDCCRCLSDEEEDAKGCSSHSNPKLTVDVGGDQNLTSALRSAEFVDHELGIDGKGKEKVPMPKPSSCAESISTDGGNLVASGDSDWNLCYKNQLFEG